MKLFFSHFEKLIRKPMFNPNEESQVIEGSLAFG